MKIITHPGQSHRDEFLACCLLIAEHGNIHIARRDPTEDELTCDQTYVIDVGGQYSQDLLNFDHHHFPRESPPNCALSMVMRHLGIYSSSTAIFPWLTPTEILDCKGPIALANWAGTDRDSLMGLMSPVESQMLQVFSRYESIDPSDCIHIMMGYIGTGILTYLNAVGTRLELLEQSLSFRVGELLCIDTRHIVSGKDDPALGLEIFCKTRLTDEPAVTVTSDDRGNGFTLFRRNDNPKIDFSRIKDEPDVVFAHTNGFIAKVKPGGNAAILIANAMDHAPSRVIGNVS